MERSQCETVCASTPAALQSVPVPSSALLARLAPLTPVPGRPDLVAHHAPDVMALWQAWEEECGAPQAALLHARRRYTSVESTAVLCLSLPREPPEVPRAGEEGGLSS